VQQSLKVSFEPTPGLSNSASRVLSALGEGAFGASTLQSQLMFILGWIHTIVEERREYLPQGWSKHYEFSVADLRAGQDIISSALNGVAEAVDVPWQQLQGLLSQVAYGGRLDNTYDQKILQTFIRASFSPGLLRDGKSIARGVPMV